ncbi:peptidyl-prolyl cis-trans isomerase [Cellulophaga baltica]|uniref:peptidylprolyl isomerase n=1 Tax=Cellulophaga TaxID=104264 RepID=UPI001C07DE3E|nr:MULTISPECIES: peptidylprolyl isomerase [Cellulophaga]MBU2998033.1 peptidyl-prolyl cis-trans isomerase [Cellulophaga baltica]MDO6769434.1 peptidylprolyl isomerase [Cellulophaga sp. 1_MG-2023]
MNLSQFFFNKLFRFLVVLVGFLFFTSCGDLIKKDQEREPLARVGEAYLYRDDINRLLEDNESIEDSAWFVTNYVNNWATKQLLLSKSKINLPADKIAEFNLLIENYKTDLYTRAYKEALILQSQDTVVTNSEIKSFYEEEKENFKLKEKLIKLRFIELPEQYLNINEVKMRLNRFNENDVKYLDSIGIQFKKINFNDSLWVKASRIINEIPPLTFENEDRYLKKSQFFEIQDSLGVYLAKVTGVLETNDTAPLSFVMPSIKQIILNRRRLGLIRSLETEIIDEAIKDKEFEVYEQD